MQVVKEYVRRWYESELDPDEYLCHQRQGNMVEIEEAETGQRRTVLTFCTNDVLGLTQNESVKQAAIDAIFQYGTSNSSTSVELICTVSLRMRCRALSIYRTLSYF